MLAYEYSAIFDRLRSCLGSQGIQKLQTNMQESIDKNFDKFELYSLKNIFSVPDDLDIEDAVQPTEHSRSPASHRIALHHCARDVQDVAGRDCG